MPRILLINPNSSAATTAMMVSIAASCCGDRAEVFGATAKRAPTMITDGAALVASATEVVEIARAHRDACDGIIVAAFGDPGAAEIRSFGSRPVVGIGEAAMRAAAQGGRRFGVATVTPALVASIAALAHGLGLSAQFTGTRLTEGDPAALAADPARLVAALAAATRACIDADGAEAVIIGGGPLAQAADQLQPQFEVPIIKPIAAAMAQLLRQLPA
ncbi:aspartate/glutamate racemase family protein [Bradyrhizobium ontarionense]|uniref:Aspartate/glutamate racemase family protein n=1 Tax=Bradyrhizobium ontarionense TaxID=2898149 RepID=A0ABY3RC26_9BRAD|nr:aspartate/glutamate racemase family protein [Bradyrhizobium sp. A19]UFZ04744.1 aspartate/glutamate racemase family protein [Bradyrhizobium sp. A19]